MPNAAKKSNAAKKPYLEHPFHCHNLHCPKSVGFTSNQGFHIRYGKAPHCAARVAACQAHLKYNSMARLSPSLLQPWTLAMKILVLPVLPIQA
jgi:hypothetical protein